MTLKFTTSRDKEETDSPLFFTTCLLYCEATEFQDSVYKRGQNGLIEISTDN